MLRVYTFRFTIPRGFSVYENKKWKIFILDINFECFIFRLQFSFFVLISSISAISDKISFPASTNVLCNFEYLGNLIWFLYRKHHNFSSINVNEIIYQEVTDGRWKKENNDRVDDEFCWILFFLSIKKIIWVIWILCNDGRKSDILFMKTKSPFLVLILLSISVHSYCELWFQSQPLRLADKWSPVAMLQKCDNFHQSNDPSWKYYYLQLTSPPDITHQFDYPTDVRLKLNTIFYWSMCELWSGFY